MPPRPEHEVFPSDFIVTLRGLIGVHQSIYPATPPQGIYLEALVEEAFRRIKIFMYRAIWETQAVRYQLVEIPVVTLRHIDKLVLEQVGKRKGRQSLGADVIRKGERIFHVHFDASDGKCSIRRLGIKYCLVLEEWSVRI